MKERLSVSWQQHPLNLVEAINDLHDKDVFCDVTVVCDGEYFPAHRLVLCSQSDYFRELLERAPCRHPFIILRDTTAEDFDALMQFIYKGSVEVPKEKVSSLMKAGTDMKIKGLYSSEDSDDEKTMKRTKERPCVREPQCILGNIPKDKSSHKSFSRELRHSLSQSAQPADEPNRIGEPQSPSEHLNEDSGHEGHEVHYVHYTESSSSLPSDESQATVRKEVSSTKASQRHHKKRSFEMQEKTTSSSQAQNPVESSSEAKRFRFSTSEGNETSQTQDPLRGDSSQAMNILTQNIKTEMVDISDHAEGTAGEGVNPEEEHYSREPGSDDNPASPSSNAASEPLRSDITKNDLKMEDTFLEFPTELDFVFNTEETMSALQERGSSNRATITPVSSKDSTSNHQRSMAKEGDYGNEPSVSKYSSEGMKKVRKNRSSAEALQLATVEVIEEMEASDNEEIHDDPSSVVSTELQQPSTSGVRRKGPPLNPDSVSETHIAKSLGGNSHTQTVSSGYYCYGQENLDFLNVQQQLNPETVDKMKFGVGCVIGENGNASCSSSVPMVCSSSSNTGTYNMTDSGPLSATNRMSSSLKTLDVRELLSRSITGNSILQYYAYHKNLERRQRSFLVHCIVEHLMNQSPRLTAIDFTEAAEKIVQLFPTERLNTYFIPCSAALGKYSGGKLATRYRNQRTKLINQKFICKATTVEDKGSTLQIEAEGGEVSEEMLAIVYLIRNTTESFEEIESKWITTRAIRLGEITNLKSFPEIMRNWPVYKQSYGPKLVDIDFRGIYAKEADNLCIKWGNLRESLVSHFIKTRPKDDLLYMLLESVSNTDARDLILFKFMHRLAPPLVVHVKNKMKWHPSFRESEDSFILLIQHEQDLARVIYDQQALLDEKSSGFPTCIMAVGPSLQDISHYLLYINDVVYTFSNIVQCVDILFKCFFVFQISYPRQSTLFWNIIQQGIYDINTKYDVKSGDVGAIISDLKL